VTSSDEAAARAVAATAGLERTCGDWPYTTEKVGDRIRALETTPGHVRHDILVEKSKVGRIIGPRGTSLKALIEATACEVFVLDKEGPPMGFPPDMRAVILVGTFRVVSHALFEVNTLLNGARPFPKQSSIEPPISYDHMGYGSEPPPGQAMMPVMPSMPMPAMDGSDLGVGAGLKRSADTGEDEQYGKRQYTGP